MQPDIIWSEHAKELLEIGAERVEAAIRRPDQEMAAGDGHPGRRIPHKMVEFGGQMYLLRVFYEPTPLGLRVVSFYRTSPHSRYWRDN